jgi:ABC-type nitrate/sulfonate/bicarbonate transport system substrate-binding protein
MKRIKILPIIAFCLLIGMSGYTEERFTDLVGQVPISAVTQTKPLMVPYITWGGDMVTFYANGGLRTQPGSIFQKQGMDIQLTPGDNFIQQVKDYLSGKTPFLRGTFRMIGMASEAIGRDPRTQGVVILQLTWSAGDHMVVRQHIKKIDDLKGKTIVLQKGGPHVGMLDDILKTAQIKWEDVNIIWAEDLTATPNSPAEMFRKNANIDACFVISPDMIGLTGGLQNIGSGAEGTVKGAYVRVSTAQLSRSIADVYVCRKDFYDANKDLIAKFVAAYLKGTEEVLDLKKAYETQGSKDLEKLLLLTQQIYGKEVIPTLEEDAYGLLADCTLVGHQGNVAFFTDETNIAGFKQFQESALGLALSRGYASKRYELMSSGLDYNAPVFTSYLTKVGVQRKERFRAEVVQGEIEAFTQRGALDENTLYSFTIYFEPNQQDFPIQLYQESFQRVLELAAKYGNVVVAVRGHSDPTLTLKELIMAGMKKGVLQRSGAPGNYSYSYKGKPLDINSIQEVIQIVESGGFDGVAEHNPRQTMQAALNLSRSRAEQVIESLSNYAQIKGINFDTSQIQPFGVGIREPFITKPKDIDEAKKNMRVEFRLVKVSAEAISPSDFDF